MNVYPMKATIDGEIVRNLRLVSEDSQTTVWRWNRDRDEAEALISTATAPTRDGASQRWVVGQHLLEPQRGCGCQHPMYTFVPRPLD